MAHSGDSLLATAESDGFVTMYLIKRGDFCCYNLFMERTNSNKERNVRVT